MEYSEALKKVQAKKTKDNYLVICLGYDKKIVLPHKDGIALLAALSNAEQLFEPYQAQHSISPFERETLTSFVLSGHEYEQYKIAALLQITVAEAKTLALDTA
jgi:hypothetical protein